MKKTDDNRNLFRLRSEDEVPEERVTSKVLIDREKSSSGESENHAESSRRTNFSPEV